MRKRFKKDRNTVEVEILNDGLRRKVGWKGVISKKNYKKAIRFASQKNRTFFPLPKTLLPQVDTPDFVQHVLKK